MVNQLETDQAERSRILVVMSISSINSQLNIHLLVFIVLVALLASERDRFTFVLGASLGGCYMVIRGRTVTYILYPR